VKPEQKDYEEYPDLKFIYLVRSSVLYGQRVRLSDLGIKDIQFGKTITEAQFEQIKQSAGEMQEFS